MMDYIAKQYGISKVRAGKHSLKDFWLCLAFDNLNSAKEEYTFKKNDKS